MVKDYSMPYATGMEDGDLVIQGFAIDPRKNKEKEATPPLPIAPGLVTTPWLVQPAYYSAFVNYEYTDDEVEGWTPREELEPVHVDFYFPQGISQLRPSFSVEGQETNREKQQYLSAFIAEKNVTRTVTITGSHSPEGAERVNTNLAKDRPDRVESYYRDMMDRYDYKGMADSINFIIKPIIRSYDEFKRMLNEYDEISAAEKQEILNILNGSGSFEQKEDALHTLSTYRKIFRDIYPDLRYAKTEILKVKEKKTDAEIAVLAKMIVEGRAPADTLIYGEMAYAAHLTPSLSEKEAIYKVATKQYPHFASHNNLGAVYLAMAIEDAKAGNDPSANLENAVTQFEISIRNRSNNAHAHGNLGTAYMMQGKMDQGYDEISQALGMNPPVKHAQGFNSVKGVIEVKQGKYDDAVRTLSNVDESPVNLFNRGLAYLLKEEYDAASNNFEEAVEKESNYAIAYYANAIAAARKGEANDLASNLKMAVNADPDLKAKAVDDLEFVQYADTESFRGALQ
jgi:tetratricopeptide (TPR) repeat protein